MNDLIFGGTILIFDFETFIRGDDDDDANDD